MAVRDEALPAQQVPTWQVTCVAKRNSGEPHERIEAIGGVGWRHTEAEAIDRLGSGSDRYYTRSGGFTARLVVGRHAGREYLKTEADQLWPDTVLALPDC